MELSFGIFIVYTELHRDRRCHSPDHFFADLRTLLNNEDNTILGDLMVEIYIGMENWHGK